MEHDKCDAFDHLDLILTLPEYKWHTWITVGMEQVKLDLDLKITTAKYFVRVHTQQRIP